jgi:aprataxin
MHIISADFQSTFLKKKDHYQSFNTSFFVPLDKVIATLQEKGKIDIDEKSMEQLLKGTMTCSLCSETFEKLAPLKKHQAACHTLE